MATRAERHGGALEVTAAPSGGTLLRWQVQIPGGPGVSLLGPAQLDLELPATVTDLDLHL